MLDILHDYLNDAVAPEAVQVITSAHDTFEQIGLENYESAFEEILMLDSQVDVGETVNAVVSLTQQLQQKILLEHGVVLTNDATIAVGNAFISGLLQIQEYDDLVQLQQVLSSDGSPEEILAMVLDLVSERDADDLMTHIETVSPFLLTKLKDYARTNEKLLDDDDPADKVVYVAAFNRFYAYIKASSLLTLNLLVNGVGPGFPFMVYAKALSTQLDSLTPKQAAQELVAMALLSSDGIDNPRAVIQANIEHLISDVDRITRIDVVVSELLLGLNQYA
jgi:hypothetical protein